MKKNSSNVILFISLSVVVIANICLFIIWLLRG